MVSETLESQNRRKVPRLELVAAIRERDGDNCMFPECGKVLDFSITEGALECTIDHIFPQHYGKANGWTWDEIWALSNLELFHKKCNAKKGDRIPNKDGTLPERITRQFKYRRQKRAERPEVCTSCNSGRNLSEDEWCNSCGSGPQPERFPRWRQMQPKDCDHDLFFCSSCVLGFVPRRSALDALLTGGNGYE